MAYYKWNFEERFRFKKPETGSYWLHPPMGFRKIENLKAVSQPNMKGHPHAIINREEMYVKLIVRISFKPWHHKRLSHLKWSIFTNAKDCKLFTKNGFFLVNCWFGERLDDFYAHNPSFIGKLPSDLILRIKKKFEEYINNQTL